MNHDVKVARLINATSEEVFDAFTDPDGQEAPSTVIACAASGTLRCPRGRRYGRMRGSMFNSPPAAANITSFYGAFTPVCFTLLGLWLVVVQTRHSEWRQSAVHRSRAYTLSINFAMPGMMGLLSLVDPTRAALWRLSFAAVGLAGMVALLWMVFRGPGRRLHSVVSVLTTWLAIVLYAVIFLVALRPGWLADLGVHLAPLEFEAIALSVLVFTAVNVAWFLLFDEAKIEG